MKTLAIETSCDETGIAIIKTPSSDALGEIVVLANTLVSQASLHAEFGGVFPNLARREHAKAIVPLLVYALTEAGLAIKRTSPRVLSPAEEQRLADIFHKEPELFLIFKESLLALETPAIDRIAVTAGPGLEPALWVGINTAEALGALWGLPVTPVNHMEGHIVAALMNTNNSGKNFFLNTPQYPALALLISGGHTELVLMPTTGTYQLLGQTRDDAVGEAFDKVARMLGLGYPGGPEISKLAEKAPHDQKLGTPLPRPMLKSGDYDFSFSGLKTSVLYAIKRFETLTDRDKELIAKDFEDSVTEVLLAKTLAAAQEHGVREIILGGGVTANKKIRKTFADQIAHELPDTHLFIPDVHLSGDNGLMIAVASLLHPTPADHIVARGTMSLA